MAERKITWTVSLSFIPLSWILQTCKDENFIHAHAFMAVRGTARHIHVLNNSESVITSDIVLQFYIKIKRNKFHNFYETAKQRK